MLWLIIKIVMISLIFNCLLMFLCLGSKKFQILYFISIVTWGSSIFILVWSPSLAHFSALAIIRKHLGMPLLHSRCGGSCSFHIQDVVGAALFTFEMKWELLFSQSKCGGNCSIHIRNVAGAALFTFEMWRELLFSLSKSGGSCSFHIRNVAGAALFTFEMWRDLTSP
jgi:hypothetical protein